MDDAKETDHIADNFELEQEEGESRQRVFDDDGHVDKGEEEKFNFKFQLCSCYLLADSALLFVGDATSPRRLSSRAPPFFAFYTLTDF
jgi:hypothetical protein